MLALVMKKQIGLGKKRGFFFVNKCFKQVRIWFKKETKIINLEISNKEYSKVIHGNICIGFMSP